MDKIIRKISIEDAEKEDIEYWKLKTPEERLDILQVLREEYYILKNEDRKRLQRVYKIIKLT